MGLIVYKLATGTGAFSNISGAKGDEGGTIASENTTPGLVQRFNDSNISGYSIL